MKKLIFLVLAIVAISFSAYTVVVRPQTPPTFSSEPRGHEELSKKKDNPLSISIRSGLVKEFEAPNGITLIDKPTVTNFTKVKTEREFKRFGKMKFEFAGTLATPSDFSISDTYGSLDIKSTKKLKNFDVALKTSYFHSQRNPFAIGGIEFSKSFNETEDDTKATDRFKARLFSNVSYYTKTQSDTNVSSAWVLRNGFETEFGFKAMRFETLAQLVNDFGAIHPGQRLFLGGEITCLVPIYGSLYAGPKLSYARYFIYDHHDEHLKRNKPNLGIEFAYFR